MGASSSWVALGILALFVLSSLLCNIRSRSKYVIIAAVRVEFAPCDYEVRESNSSAVNQI